MGQNLYKNWLLVSKIIWGIWITSDKQWLVSSAKTLHSEDLSNITFNYCENSPNSLCHFWNHKSFFMTQLVCIFLAQTLHTFEKYSIKVRIFRFCTAQVKIYQILSFFKQKVSFSSKFGSLFNAMRDNSSVLFHLKLICFRKKEPIKAPIIRL